MVEWSWAWWTIFWLVFCAMEWIAWALHKYVMHGFLWNLHEDHHVVNEDRFWQYNDAFALFFAVPSFFSILFSNIFVWPLLGAFGFGLMAYGAAYFFVHEVLIHRRLTFLDLDDWTYVRAMRMAHHVHHAVRTKHGTQNFGMLVVAPEYWRRAKMAQERLRNASRSVSGQSKTLN